MERLNNYEDNALNIDAYFDGEIIDGSDLLKQLKKEVEKGSKCYLFMDVDGCLIESALETAGNHRTLEEWKDENLDNINEFNENLALLKEKGVNIGLSTGRGWDFSKRLIEEAFKTNESQISLDKSIIEGGLLVHDSDTDDCGVSPVVDKESADLLRDNRDQIIKLGESLGGHLEEGKFLAVSFNPPEIDGKRSTDDFEEILLDNIDEELKKGLVITHSSSAVDITPMGVDKMSTLKELVGSDGVVIFVGDGKNDESSMRDLLVRINLSPNNAHKDIKEMIKSDSKLGLISEKDDIEGINECLGLLNQALD